MSQIFTDPEKLREFATKLSGFTAKVKEECRAMEHALVKTGNTWKDDQYTEFVGEYRKMLDKLRVFETAIEKETPRLKDSASAIDDFQKHRLPH